MSILQPSSWGRSRELLLSLQQTSEGQKAQVIQTKTTEEVELVALQEAVQNYLSEIDNPVRDSFMIRLRRVRLREVLDIQQKRKLDDHEMRTQR